MHLFLDLIMKVREFRVYNSFFLIFEGYLDIIFKVEFLAIEPETLTQRPHMNMRILIGVEGKGGGG